MAAKVYAPPASVEQPEWSEYEVDGQFSIEAMRERDARYITELAAWVKSRPRSSADAGTVVSYPVADGAAQYMIMRLRPLELIHLPLGDAYRCTAIFERGLTAQDIKAELAWRDRFAKLAAEQAGRKS